MWDIMKFKLFSLWIVYVLLIVPGSATEEDPKLYGLDTSQGDSLSSGAKKSWVDPNIKLGAGTVISIVAFIGDLSKAEKPLYVRFQIWTTEGTMRRLEWEKRIEFNAQHSNKLFKYNLTKEEQIDVNENYHLGFTSEQSACPISSKAIQEYTVRFRSVKDNEFPEVGQKYMFDTFKFPAKFGFGFYIGKTPKVGKLTYSGNPIVSASDLDQAGDRSWIDQEHVLTKGLLEKVDFYAGQVQGTNVQVHMQVWMAGAGSQYTLLWEKPVSVDKGMGKYSVNVPEWGSVVVNDSCRIGWTYRAEGPIQYTFDPSVQTIAYKYKQRQYPEKGKEYEFDQSFPYRFSVGMWINTAKTVQMTTPRADPPSGGSPKSDPINAASHCVASSITMFLFAISMLLS